MRGLYDDEGSKEHIEWSVERVIKVLPEENYEGNLHENHNCED